MYEFWELTVALPEVDVAGIDYEDHEQRVPACPMYEGTDPDKVAKPGAVLAEHIDIRNDDAGQGNQLHIRMLEQALQ